MKSLCSLMLHYLSVLFGHLTSMSIFEQPHVSLSKKQFNLESLFCADSGMEPHPINLIAAPLPPNDKE